MSADLAVHEFGLEQQELTAQRPVLLLHGFASSTELNWVRTGWVNALTTAGHRVIAVDLPGHGDSSAPQDIGSYVPSRIRAMIRQALIDCGVVPLDASAPDSSGVDVIGYSLGSRLAWEFGAAYPELVHRMVLGGPSAEDPLAAFDTAAAEQHLAEGAEISDPLTAELLQMARLVPENNLKALLTLIRAIAEDPFDPAERIPQMPLLLVAGEQDHLTKSMPRLAELKTQTGGAPAQTLLIPGRTHANAVTSRVFKEAALAFLGSSADHS
ncbi:alpha/beta hydrolase [Acaricomes phytoseiuli]|uniref:alpha/beta fold hydrolase n=1 Tax=Acaricomes phytoseiuli TaxID=291968 RepID=UPI0022231043|nr:alpha/beta hydrolase [Acaricomes phytoseiuli]MCW1249289.1 alpha/beta hydrolase [Acaricomes phytoseiuli]